MNNLKTLKIANFVFLIGTLVMNFLSQTPDLFELTMQEAGEMRAIFFLPAGYVFAIWGIIYTGLIAFAVYQARSNPNADRVTERISYWFIVSSIANITWLVLYLSNLVWLSTIAMLVILVALIRIYQGLGIGQRAVSLAEKWAVHIPFSIYLGWISVATIANFASALYDSGQVMEFVGIGADVWAAIMMVVAGVLGIIFLVRRFDIAVGLVLIWALVGIYNRPFDTETYQVLSNLDAGLVNTVALGVAGAVGFGVIGTLVRRIRMN